MMAAYRENPVEFEKFRKSLTAADETGRLNAMTKADTVLANNTKYMNLINSKKPEDQQAAATMRQNLINEVCDLYYHSLVLLAKNQINLSEIFEEFNNRNNR
jgi:phosphoribosyl-ATP pyrophosphohydrolase